jgi:CheY-like chemotaxis protein
MSSKLNLWSLKGMHVLVIDDFPGMRSVLRSMLSSYNASGITEATNGEEAIERISEKPYDIILCDYNLGDGKDGQQVLEEAKARNLIPYSCVYIMTTGENNSEMVMGAVEYQPDDYLAKPFTKQTLIARLKSLIDKKSMLKSIAIAKQQNDYALATKLCDKLLDKKPKNKNEILKIKAEMLLEMEDFSAAEEIYSDILEERDLPWASYGIAKALYQGKHYAEARSILEALTCNHPNYVFSHDLLSLVYQKMGNSDLSQVILSKAVEKSPKAILRQKALAKISFDNEDYDTSQDAYKRVIRIGKYSCYKGPEDYLGLAQTYVRKGSNIEALKHLGKMKKEFRRASPPKRMKALVSEVILYHELAKSDETKQSLHAIISAFDSSPHLLTSQDALQLAKICYQHKMNDEGDIFIAHVVRNNHDNQKMLDELASSLSSIDNYDVANIITNTRNEVIALNNKGVELATNGQIEDSISLFAQAASAMPENDSVNLNASQSLIMYMNKNGASADILRDVMNYLSRISKKVSRSEKHQKLLNQYRKLQSSLK